MNFHRTLLSGIKTWVLSKINTTASTIEANTDNKLNNMSETLRNEIPTNVSELNNDSGYLTEHQDLSGYATTEDIPTTLSDLTEDETHRLVTDEEKENWNNTSWNELSDRPFGEEEILIELDYFELCDLLTSQGFYENKDDEIVRVVYDNESYDLTAITYEYDYYTFGYLGNASLIPFYQPDDLNINTDLPFCIWYVGKEDSVEYLYMDDTTTHNTTVNKISFGINYIDDKFISSSIARVSDIPEVPEHTWESLPDKPFYETKKYELIASGDNATINSTSNEIVNLILIEGETYKITPIDSGYYDIPIIIWEGEAQRHADGYLYLGYPSEQELRTSGEMGYHINDVDKRLYYRLGSLYEGYYSYTIEHKIEEIKTLDVKYIPSSIARVEELNTLSDSINTKVTELQTYADNVAINVKNDLLNGAGEAYDTLKELGELIDENQDAIQVFETVAINKADKEHEHNWEELNGRPFYDTVNTTVIIDTNEINEEYDINGDLAFAHISSVNMMDFEEGMVFHVTTDFYDGESTVDSVGRLPIPYRGGDEAYLYIEYSGYRLKRFGAYLDITKLLVTYTTGELKTLDDKFIPSSIARVSDIPTESELFSGSWNDLSDKPFGESECLASGAILTSFSYKIEPLNLEENDVYTVIYDGEKYTLPVTAGRDIYGGTHLYLGNAGLGVGDGMEDNGMPFVIYQSGTNVCYAKNQNTSTEHTFELYLGDGGVHTLDEKFVPDTISRTSHIHSWNDLTDKPFYDSEEYLCYSGILNGESDLDGRNENLNIDKPFEKGNVIIVIDGEPIEITLDAHVETSPTGVKRDYYTAYVQNGDIYFNLTYYPDYPNIAYIAYSELFNGLSIELYSKPEIKQLDEKFIPSTIARFSDLNDAVGYMISITGNGIEESTLTDEITSITESVNLLNSDEATEGSVDYKIKQVADIKADKSTTLSGYGITDAYTKSDVDTAIATSADSTLNRILGETIDADYDTLQEVADWIKADTTNSAELMVRVTNIENDYYNSTNLTPMTEADIDAILNS